MSFGKNALTYSFPKSLGETSNSVFSSLTGIPDSGLTGTPDRIWDRTTWEENQILKAELAEKDLIIAYLEEQVSDAQNAASKQIVEKLNVLKRHVGMAS